MDDSPYVPIVTVNPSPCIYANLYTSASISRLLCIPILSWHEKYCSNNRQGSSVSRRSTYKWHLSPKSLRTIPEGRSRINVCRHSLTAFKNPSPSLVTVEWNIVHIIVTKKSYFPFFKRVIQRIGPQWMVVDSTDHFPKSIMYGTITHRHSQTLWKN